MTKKSLPTTKTLLAAAATLAPAPTGSACSGEGGADDGAADGREAATTSRTEPAEGADAEYDGAIGEGRCTVEYDLDRVTTDRIAGAIEEAGFTPTLVSGSSGP